MPRRIDAGEVLAALGGLLVFVSLFLSWFVDRSGWAVFEALDLVIAALALAVVWAAMSSLFSLPTALSPRALPVLGAVLLAIVAVQLIQPPPVVADDERQVGAWLALAGAALVLLGGALRAAKISVTVSVGPKDVRRRVPAVDRRPVGAPSGPAPEPAADSAVRFVAADAPPPAEPHEDQATQPFSSLDPTTALDPAPQAAPASAAGAPPASPSEER